MTIWQLPDTWCLHNEPKMRTVSSNVLASQLHIPGLICTSIVKAWANHGLPLFQVLPQRKYCPQHYETLSMICIMVFTSWAMARHQWLVELLDIPRLSLIRRHGTSLPQTLDSAVLRLNWVKAGTIIYISFYLSIARVIKYSSVSSSRVFHSTISIVWLGVTWLWNRSRRIFDMNCPV